MLVKAMFDEYYARRAPEHGVSLDDPGGALKVLAGLWKMANCPDTRPKWGRWFADASSSIGVTTRRYSLRRARPSIARARISEPSSV